jgi:hypothetical protein
LGLNHEENDWVFVERDDHKERCIDENRNITPKSPRGILKTPGERKITPPLQFQDDSTTCRDEIDFCESELPCTSTPKGTPQTTNKNSTKMRTVNLLGNFNE